MARGADIFSLFCMQLCKKKLKLAIERENMEEIHLKQGRCPRITGTLTVSHYFLPTEFLPCFFQVDFIPPWGVHFWPKYLPWKTFSLFVYVLLSQSNKCHCLSRVFLEGRYHKSLTGVGHWRLNSSFHTCVAVAYVVQHCIHY